MGYAPCAGLKAKVCNVYYSGCPLKNHWEWWKSGEAFFVTDENGRAKTEGTNLEYCLKQENWDIISLMEGAGYELRKNGADQHFINTKMMLDDLWGYIKEQFPMSRYLWFQGWAYQVGADRNGVQMKDINQQLYETQFLKDCSILVCNAYDLERVNTGEAWHLVRQGDYDELCARLGVNGDKGDYSHDGDIGGGQYLNACVWYEIITGQSCFDNAYRPEYQGKTLSGNLVKLLQESVQQAVEQRKTEIN